MSLADFRGKVVLLNIWATWCAPCRREMPTLERLQAELGGPDFEVVALSIDRQGRPVVAGLLQGTRPPDARHLHRPVGQGAARAERAGRPDHAPDRPRRQRGRPSAWPSRMGQPGDGGLHPRTNSAAIRGVAAAGTDEPLASDGVRRPVAGAGPAKPLPSSDWKAPPLAESRRQDDELTGNRERDQAIAGPGLARRAALLAAAAEKAWPP